MMNDPGDRPIDRSCDNDDIELVVGDEVYRRSSGRHYVVDRLDSRGRPSLEPLPMDGQARKARATDSLEADISRSIRTLRALHALRAALSLAVIAVCAKALRSHGLLPSDVVTSILASLPVGDGEHLQLVATFIGIVLLFFASVTLVSLLAVLYVFIGMLLSINRIEANLETDIATRSIVTNLRR